ncbi:MAG: hypothetical protein JO131_00360, partial [Gammaproteobacteria bacterium]|nr:hypothetical protein [Gammaproteobacteria bacterium]
MPKTYTQICTEAEKKWKFSEKRSGYTRTFLSNLRHYGFLGFFDSKKRIVNKQAQEVLALLQTLTDETAKKHIILAFLNQNKSKLNNHSFGCYLIDILRQEYPNDGWEKYEPKPVIHFQGELFHGTYIQPKTIFSQGLISNNHSSNIEDYIVTTSGSIGISTSKNMDVAKKYALPEPLRSGGD